MYCGKHILWLKALSDVHQVRLRDLRKVPTPFFIPEELILSLGAWIFSLFLLMGGRNFFKCLVWITNESHLWVFLILSYCMYPYLIELKWIQHDGLLKFIDQNNEIFIPDFFLSWKINIRILSTTEMHILH